MNDDINDDINEDTDDIEKIEPLRPEAEEQEIEIEISDIDELEAEEVEEIEVVEDDINQDSASESEAESADETVSESDDRELDDILDDEVQRMNALVEDEINRDSRSKARRKLLVWVPTIVLLIGLLVVVYLLLFKEDRYGASKVAKGSVYQVDGVDVSKKEYDHWLKIALIAQVADKNALPYPPYTKCIAALRKTDAESTDAQLKTQCSSAYDSAKQQVGDFLTSRIWIDHEASRLGVKTTDKEVDVIFANQKKASFKTEKDFQKYLVASGMTVEDLRSQVSLRLKEDSLREKVTAKSKAPTEQEIKAYYDQNKDQFQIPETRDIRIVLTKQKTKAEAAKKELQNGNSFANVAKKYSIDQSTRSNGGLLLGVTKGDQGAELDNALFAAKKDQLVGVRQSEFGWFVFKVVKIKAAEKISYKSAKAEIKQNIINQRAQEQLTVFSDDLAKRYKPKTYCKREFLVSACKDAPRKQADTQGQITGNRS